MVQFGVPRKEKSLISLTPLIDVVFILLVFFMLATNFTKWHAIELSFGEPASVIDVEKKATLIKVINNNTLMVKEIRYTFADIEKMLKNKLQKDIDHAVLLQPTDDVSLQEIVTIMEKLRYLIGDNISLANAADR